MVQVQQTAAMLTTFNEIDMTAVQDVRKRHQEDFQKAHGVSLGIMSFFARAAVLALKQFPILNASLDGNDIVYHDYVHLGIAVSTDRGLVVPVLRNCQSLSLARIEGEIKRVAAAAREGKLSIEELSGGTFTITNGGIFGSLLSTPILSAPQSGILGMHAIQDRPVGVDGQIVLRPMMYVALTYDHRLIDGRDSVSFLVRLKHLLENPMQMLLEI
jgi:2-oxoglutarate dehydrogenase E2 component (dihydrolipoamide succinyltransferase)